MSRIALMTKGSLLAVLLVLAGCGGGGDGAPGLASVGGASGNQTLSLPSNTSSASGGGSSSSGSSAGSAGTTSGSGGSSGSGSAGSSGSGGSGSGSGGGSSPLSTGYRMFSLGNCYCLINAWSTLSPAAGATLTHREIGTSAVGIFAFSGIGYDGTNDRFFDGSQGSIAVYDGASQITGTAAPTRTIHVDRGPGLVGKLVADPASDSVYYSSQDNANNFIRRIFHISTASGQLVPDLNFPLAIAASRPNFVIDFQRSLLYILDHAQIQVYDLNSLQDASALGVGVTNQPLRIIQGTGWSAVSDIALDAARDRLYVGEYGTPTANGLYIVPNASSAASGSFAKLNLNRPQAISYYAAADRLFVGQSPAQLLVLESASTLDANSAIPAALVIDTPNIGDFVMLATP